MAKGVDPLDPSDSMRTLFGHRLKRLRLAAGLTQEALGTRVRVHSTRITQIERATATMPTLPLTQQLDEAVRADGLLVDLWPHMYRENFPDWSRAYMAAEAEAVAIWAYMGQPVHGLLQTPEYARAMLRLGRSLRTPEQLEQRVSSRLARQERLRAADAPQLWVILDEAVFLRPVGGPAVMRGQMARLLEAAKEPHITLQVLPFSHGEHAAMGGSLNILDLPDGGTVAYTEGADSGQLIDEPEEVKPYTVNYDFLRAEALPSTVSLDLIRSVMEDNYRAARVPTRSQRRRLAQVQSQQSGGRGLRRGR